MILAVYSCCYNHREDKPKESWWWFRILSQTSHQHTNFTVCDQMERFSARFRGARQRDWAPTKLLSIELFSVSGIAMAGSAHSRNPGPLEVRGPMTRLNSFLSIVSEANPAQLHAHQLHEYCRKFSIQHVMMRIDADFLKRICRLRSFSCFMLLYVMFMTTLVELFGLLCGKGCALLSQASPKMMARWTLATATLLHYCSQCWILRLATWLLGLCRHD